jgi:hypothetical protein
LLISAQVAFFRSRRLRVLRMILLNPGFYQTAKLSSACYQFLRFGIGNQTRVVVIYLISFLPTGVEVVDERLVSRAQDQRRGFECRRMMAGFGGSGAVARAGEDHLGKLLNGVVGDREAPVGRQLGDCGVFKIAFDDGAQFVELAAAGLMTLQTSRC